MAHRGLLTRDGIKDAVVLTSPVRQGEGDERLRGAHTRIRTYNLTDEDSDWVASLQIDQRHPMLREWAGENGLYLLPTHNEERAWNMEKLRVLNDQGNRPVARNFGIRAKEAVADTADGLRRQTYLRRGAR